MTYKYLIYFFFISSLISVNCHKSETDELAFCRSLQKARCVPPLIVQSTVYNLVDTQTDGTNQQFINSVFRESDMLCYSLIKHKSRDISDWTSYYQTDRADTLKKFPETELLKPNEKAGCVHLSEILENDLSQKLDQPFSNDTDIHLKISFFLQKTEMGYRHLKIKLKIQKHE